MFWLIATIILLLFLPFPVRKVFFAAWRFTLPTIGGFVFALVMLKVVMKINLPGLMVLGISVFIALVVGVEGMQWFNEMFGSGRR